MPGSASTPPARLSTLPLLTPISSRGSPLLQYHSKNFKALDKLLKLLMKGFLLAPEFVIAEFFLIQRALGCKSNPMSIDLRAACSGFLAGLLSVAGYIRGLGYRNVIVVGADVLSSYVDWTDRGSCVLFDDAAGAAVVQACDPSEDSFFRFDAFSDGDGQRH